MILLIKPESAHNPFSLDMVLKTEPLELEYIYTILTTAGHDVFIYDPSLQNTHYHDLLIEKKPDIIAITGYITQENLMKQYIEQGHKLLPNALILVGGSYVQLNPERFFDTCVDFICRSDDIFIISKLVELYQNYQKDIPANELIGMNGLCYKQDGIWIKEPLQPFDINRLPIPDRHYFHEHQQSYRYLDVSPVALLKTSSSCPFQCSFCYGSQLNNGVYRTRDLSFVIEEILTIDCFNIQIIDDDFLVDRNRLITFISLIKQYHIQKNFICYGRADFIVQNPDIIKALKEIGFNYIMVGLEAMENSSLKHYNKKTTVDINEHCVHLLNSLNIKTVGLFIVDINFRPKDFKNLKRWIQKNQIIYTGISIFTPIPGTPLFKEYQTKLITNDIEKWDFMHLVVQPQYLSPTRFYFEYYRLIIALFRIAKKNHIYDFICLSDYKPIFLKLIFKESFQLKSNLKSNLSKNPQIHY